VAFRAACLCVRLQAASFRAVCEARLLAGGGSQAAAKAAHRAFLLQNKKRGRELQSSTGIHRGSKFTEVASPPSMSQAAAPVTAGAQVGQLPALQPHGIRVAVLGGGILFAAASGDCGTMQCGHEEAWRVHVNLGLALGKWSTTLEGQRPTFVGGGADQETPWALPAKPCSCVVCIEGKCCSLRWEQQDRRLIPGT
jgi:hypothetical protein